MFFRFVVASVLVAPILCSCALRSFQGSSDVSSKSIKTLVPTAAERDGYIQNAEVWRPSSVAEKDLLRGPNAEKGYQLGQTVQCRYVEPEDEEIDGRSNKFYCDKADGDRVKVKYGLDNGEVYAEVAATRLLWALGFGADTVTSVRVECANCPADPMVYFQGMSSQGADEPSAHIVAAGERKTRIFVPAAVEEKFKGVKIEMKEDQGWSWKELMNFSSVSPEKQIHREALGLLMSILQHPDSKGENQRLVCLKDGIQKSENGSIRCTKPFAIVQDVGWTFTSGWKAKEVFTIGKMHFEGWNKTPVWADAKTCLTNLNGLPPMFTGTFEKFRVRESARAFLAKLLNQLTEKQMNDMFIASRVEFIGGARQVSEQDAVVAKWVAALKRKIAEVNAVRCPQ